MARATFSLSRPVIGFTPARLLFAVLVSGSCIAGGQPKSPKKHIVDEGTAGARPPKPPSEPKVQSGGITWTLVDTMQNAYSMLSNRVEPLSFDPVSGYVGLIHRGKTSYASSSGELWYNTTHLNNFQQWTRISSLNGGAPANSRYPSAWIASGAGAGSELFTYSAPQLNPGAFGYVIFGVDLLNAAAPFGVEDQGGLYWSNTRITAADDSPNIWWAASYDPNVSNPANAAVHLWSTQDYGTVGEIDIWDLSLFQTRGLEIGLCYRSGILYLGGYATLVGDPNEVMNVFYSKSTDNGLTWTAPDGPNIGVGDWRTLPAIASSPYDDWEEHMSFDMQVDYLGQVHFLGVLEDQDDPLANLAVVEVREDSAGWTADIVADNLYASTNTNYGAVDQMGYHVGSAMDPEGTSMTALWLSAPAPGDSLPDIWQSYYSYNQWWPAQNISNTPDQAELLLQVAPVLYINGGFPLVFIARAYEQGTEEYPPNDVSPTEIFAASFGPIDLGVDPGLQQPSSTRLSQNFPNPFNAQTRISFTVSNPQSVILIAYDLLGREVATLVNERKEAGTHSVTWDAAGLPSGVYYYRLHAGGYVETKKLVLLR